jgi:hypothetical protein
MILACVCSEEKKKNKEKGETIEGEKSFIDDLGKWNGNNT